MFRGVIKSLTSCLVYDAQRREKCRWKDLNKSGDLHNYLTTIDRPRSIWSLIYMFHTCRVRRCVSSI